MRIKGFSILLCLLLIINQGFLLVYAAPVQQSKTHGQTIQQANNLARTAHSAYNQKDYLKAAQNYEKAYQLSRSAVFLDNCIVAYTAYAYDLANSKDYDKAISYGNKVLALRPNDKNAKELLADVYFSKGADLFYTGALEKAKVELENSLKYCVIQEQTDRAKDGLAKLDEAIKTGKKPIPRYEQTADASIPEIVTAIENKIYGSANTSQPLLNRVSKLETDTLGQKHDADGLIIRVDRLKRSVLPEYTQPQQYTSQNYADEDNYLRAIIEQSMGRVTIFGKIPITVYIDDPSVKPYKKFYREAVIDALKAWEEASETRVAFKVIPEPGRADIQIVWVEDFEDFPWQPTLKKDDISAEKERMKYRKAGAAVQVGSILTMIAGGLIGVPVIGSMGAIGNSVASPYLQYKGTKNDKLSPDVKINVKVTEGMTDEAAKSKIKQITMHQIGHAIGIYGHSSNPDDIMYSNFTTNQLSERDVNTIREIYKSKEPQKKDQKEKKSTAKK